MSCASHSDGGHMTTPAIHLPKHGNLINLRLTVTTLGGSSFELDVERSSRGCEVKQMLSEMDRTLRVSAMRLFHEEREISDHLEIGLAILSTSALLSLVIRLPECENFLLNPYSLKCASDDIRADMECVLRQVKREPMDLAYTELRNDKRVVLTAVEINGYALAHAGERLQDDIDVVLAAACADKTNTKGCLQHASSRLRRMPEISLLEKRGLADIKCERSSCFFRLAKCSMYLLDIMEDLLFLGHEFRGSRWIFCVIPSLVMYFMTSEVQAVGPDSTSLLSLETLVLVAFRLILLFTIILVGVDSFASLDSKLETVLIDRAKRTVSQKHL